LLVNEVKAKVKMGSMIVGLSIGYNEQGFAMLGDLKNVKPGTAAD